MSPIRLIIVLLLAGLTGATVIWLLVRGSASDSSLAHQVAVTVPQLSGAAASGKETTKPSGDVAAAASINAAMSDMSPEGAKLYSNSTPKAAAASCSSSKQRQQQK